MTGSIPPGYKPGIDYWIYKDDSRVNSIDYRYQHLDRNLAWPTSEYRECIDTYPEDQLAAPTPVSILEINKVPASTEYRPRYLGSLLGIDCIK